MKRFEKLLEPSYIGPIKTRNRIIKTGASTCYWHENDIHMSEKAKAYYEALARGGVGLLIVESPTIDYPLGARWKERYRIDDDKYINGLNELTRVIHKHGCPTFMQMWHDGPWQSPLFPNYPATFDGPPIGASPVNLNVPGDFHRDVPRELTTPEIEEIVGKFASAAVRAQKAGFDGVDINAASSHLFHNFMSPFWNRRVDAYGGSTENRTRFLVQVIREIKKRTGRDFPVSTIINGIELGRAIGVKDEECMTAEESRKIAWILQEAGADAIEVRAEFYTRPEDDRLRDSTHFPEMYFYPEPPKILGDGIDGSRYGAGATLPMAAAIKKVVSIPVVNVGRLDLEIGERAIRRGRVDFIGLNRRLLPDPELPNKIASGRLQDIRPCTGCLTCYNLGEHGQPVYCQVNAALGREREFEIKPAEPKKKVIVIGGGPAGIEAARVAALRGHEVSLYEREHRLGGALLLAAMVKGFEREDLLSLIHYFERQVTKLGVKISLDTEINPSLVRRMKPDVLVVAAGGRHHIPELPGMNGRNVMITGRDLHNKLKVYLGFLGPTFLRWLTRFWMPLGKRVVIVGGGA